ncbi:MAG: SdpI family protein [Desulfomonile tiedjei]|uniref:SdpI family protein n=1 Tax=Desulfomonile tiedjei TaxID=2358 RepID=A0A9D6V0Q1_9BACT|nr:SdpI family protein [Desulfomonile tiedjei]
MIPPIAVHCGIGLLTTAIAIPLVLRKVPMNRFYGVRIPKAFESDRNWYDINAYGGRLFLAFGLLLTFFGIVAQGLAPSPTSIWSAVFIAGPLLLIFPILALISAYARRLPG